jgi:hypothetical protein
LDVVCVFSQVVRGKSGVEMSVGLAKSYGEDASFVEYRVTFDVSALFGE